MRQIRYTREAVVQLAKGGMRPAAIATHFGVDYDRVVRDVNAARNFRSLHPAIQNRPAASCWPTVWPKPGARGFQPVHVARHQHGKLVDAADGDPLHV